MWKTCDKHTTPNTSSRPRGKLVQHTRQWGHAIKSGAQKLRGQNKRMGWELATSSVERRFSFFKSCLLNSWGRDVDHFWRVMMTVWYQPHATVWMRPLRSQLAIFFFSHRTGADVSAKFPWLSCPNSLYPHPDISSSSFRKNSLGAAFNSAPPALCRSKVTLRGFPKCSVCTQNRQLAPWRKDVQTKTASKDCRQSSPTYLHSFRSAVEHEIFSHFQKLVTSFRKIIEMLHRCEIYSWYK